MKIKTDFTPNDKFSSTTYRWLSMIIVWAVIMLSTVAIFIAVLAETRRMSVEVSAIKNELESIRSENIELKENINALRSDNARMQDVIDTLNKELEEYDNMTLDSKISESAVYAISEPIYEITTLSMDRHDTSSIQYITGASREHLLELIEWAIERRYRTYSDDHPVALAVDDLIYIEQEYGISATAILSIATWESGLCDSEDWPDEFRYANNACGIMDSDSARSFDNVGECLVYTAELLKYSYIDKGYESLYEIGPIYCDESWGGKVYNTMETYNEKLRDIMN